MPTNPNDVPHRPDAEHRRWLIGVGISVVFGSFGAVMAWLSYSAKTRVQQAAPAQAAPPSYGEHGKRRQHKTKD